MSVPNVLANRYASQQLRTVWSPENKIVAERLLWIAVLAAQRDLGVDFGGDDPDAVIDAYTAQVEKVDWFNLRQLHRVAVRDFRFALTLKRRAS